MAPPQPASGHTTQPTSGHTTGDTSAPLPFGDAATPRPLRGVRVLDLGQFIAGPACGQLLADYGADVTKVEPPAGDPSRALGRTEHGSVYFRQYNTGKASVALDLTAEDDRDRFETMLAESHAVVANFTPRTLARLGLDWPTLHARHPHLVLVVISAWGDGDPRTAFDSVAQAVSGYAWLSSDDDGSPRIAAGYPTDVLSGLHAGTAAAMALLDPQRTTGVLVDVPMIETAMSALCGPAVLTGRDQGAVAPGRGNRDAATAPSTVFPCADGWAYLYAGLDKHWARLAAVVGGPEAPLEERLADPARFEEPVSAWTRSRSVADVCDEVTRLGIAAGPVNDPRTALDQLHASRPGAVVTTARDGAALPQLPVAFAGARVPRGAAPPLGDAAPDRVPDPAPTTAPPPDPRCREER